MKKSELQTGRLGSHKKTSVALVLPSPSECRRLNQGLRDQLEGAEQKIQIAHDRLMADALREGLDEAVVCSASATVILSIAASMMELVSFRVGKTLDDAEFVAAARVALKRSGAKCTPPMTSFVDSFDYSGAGKRSS
jgi:hypothetical protein